VKMAGIQECAALPTGLIMYDMRVFELTEPKTLEDKPWFYYEWSDMYASNKASTEDVTMTRDVSLVGTQKLGYNPVYCNWDAWAGHWKPKCVGKPVFIEANGVSDKMKQCWEAGVDNSVKLVDFKSPIASRLLPKILAEVCAEHSDGSVQKMQLLESLMDKAPAGVFLEVGNREGGSLLLAVEHRNSTAVVGVDPYGGIPYRIPNGPITAEYDDAMHARMLGLIRKSKNGGKLTHHKITSDEYMESSGGTYAFVYLDGSHEPDVVAREIEFFSSRMQPGGIIAVDDTEVLPPSLLAGWQHPGNMAWKRFGDRQADLSGSS